MVAKAEKKEKLDYMIDKMQRILDALEEIRDGDVTETAVLKKYGLDHKTFRNMVYDHDWDAATRVDGRKKKGSAEKVEGVIPTRSWAEDLFVEVYRIKDCSIPIPDDVTERFEEVIPALPGNLPDVIFMLYRDGLTLKEAGEELGKSGERIRQLRERALRMLRNQRRTAYMLMGAPGEEVYISRMRAEELKEKAENDYTCRMMRKEIERLDRLIWAKKKIIKDEQEVIPIEEWDTLNIHLSVRGYNALKKSGVSTFGQLLALTYDDLLNIRNLGRKTAEDIMEELGKAGFTLAEEDE
jgi:hypothetical protein